MSQDKTSKDTPAYLSSLSHELRSPLNGVVGYCHLLLNTSLDKTQKRYCTSMSECCLQLVQILNDMLDFSNLVSGSTSLGKDCIRVPELLEELRNTLSVRLQEKKQKLRIILAPEIPEFVVVDKVKLLQILINLVSNSIKFSPKDTRILVSASVKEGSIEFSVEDSGVGISQENIGKIFLPFFRVQDTLLQNGSGLGLAIAKRLVEVMGGEIHVQSEKDVGSVFTFSVKYETYIEFEERLKKNRKYLAGKHVLILDGSVESRIELGDMLFEQEMIPVMCSTLREAVRILAKGKYTFSAIICVESHEANPRGTVRELLQETLDIPVPPVIAISPFSVEKSQNIEAVLESPVSRIKLLDILQKVILFRDPDRSCALSSSEEGPCSPKQEVSVYSGISVLIVDDSKHGISILEGALESMGVERVDSVEDGKEALQKLEQDPGYDILLLDLVLPGRSVHSRGEAESDHPRPSVHSRGEAESGTHFRESGKEIIQAVREKKGNKPKVIVISGSVSENTKRECKELGVKYFLSKPVNLTHFKMIFGKVVKNSLRKKVV